VFSTEPLPAGHPFFGLENVLLSPHSTDHTRDWLERALQFFLTQFERFAKGEALMNVWIRGGGIRAFARPETGDRETAWAAGIGT
jgi:phosphoglycerate dehydrogenase-like enzyme